MANQHQSDSMRRPQPESAAQDPRDASVQQRVRADSAVTREEVARVRATTPAEVSEKTVGEIAEAAERRAQP